MQIGNRTIHTSKKVYKALVEKYASKESQPALYYYLLGAYESRFLGICVYRSANSMMNTYAKVQEANRGLIEAALKTLNNK